jgi:hypothetical protein
MLDLKAVPNATAAAEYYPAIYWWSMLHVPDQSQFPVPAPAALAFRPRYAAKPLGSRHSRPTAASAATRSAIKQCARSPQASAASIPVWVPLGSGHMGSFDRRKCKGPLKGADRNRSFCQNLESSFTLGFVLPKIWGGSTFVLRN